MAPLDPDAVAAVLEQLCPAPRDPDELHDLLLSLVACRPYGPWEEWFAALAADGRATELDGCWVATERREAAAALGTDDEAAAACAAGHLQLAGPVTVDELVADAPLPPGAPLGAPLTVPRARTALARLEGTGVAIELPDGRWCARHLLVRLHAAGRRRRRGLVEAVPISDYVRFLTRWQHATPALPARGPGRAARGAGAVGGDRGAGGGVGGPDPPDARPRLRPALARRAVPVGRGGLGAAHAAGRAHRAQRHTVARHAARLRQARRAGADAARRCGPGRRRPSPRWVRGPTCSPRCARAAPASGPSSPR